jgi:hypothetical protein
MLFFNFRIIVPVRVPLEVGRGRGRGYGRGRGMGRGRGRQTIAMDDKCRQRVALLQSRKINELEVNIFFNN